METTWRTFLSNRVMKMRQQIFQLGEKYAKKAEKVNEMCICDAGVTVRGVKGWEMAAQVVTNTLFCVK